MLSAGVRLGAYEILNPIGAGGMGEVYRARDTALNRDVAIKVLPPIFAADPGRLARFEREAQTLAALNHPNIAHIYGIEQGALVMEFAEGEDLAARVSRGAIPAEEAIAIAQQIADAIEAAHERGIIHRDLKPANVKVAADGTVKVLDFGLAKAMDAGTSSSGAVNLATVTSPAQMTHAGVILGTAAYMAPEQARGKGADRRADIWAFGVVLYEMLTGHRAFDGDTMTDVLSAVISREPDWQALPVSTPANVRELLRRCLEKDPRERLQAIGEARIALGHPSHAMPVASVAPRRLSGAVIAVGIVLAFVSAGVGWMIASRRSVPDTTPLRLSVSLAPADDLAGAFALSPDGTTLAFVGRTGVHRQVFVRRFGSDQAVPLAGTDSLSEIGPVFSPDGKWIAFMTVGALEKVMIDGGSPILLAQGYGVSRPAWGPDGTIVFSNANRGLSRVSESGGPVRVISTIDVKGGEMVHEMPYILPDGKTVLYDIRTTTSGTSTGESMIVAQSLETGARRPLFSGVVLGLVNDDRLIVSRDRAIYAIPFDVRRQVATGEPVQIQADTSARTVLYTAVPLFSISRNGTAVFDPSRTGEDQSALALVDRSGVAKPVGLPFHRYADPRVSPDGTRVAVHIFEEGRDNWIVDLARGTLMRLTFDPGEDETPLWSADGQSVFYASTRTGFERAIFRKAADGSGPEQLIWKGSPHVHLGSVTPDGRTLIISETLAQQSDIARVDVADGVLTPLLTNAFSKFDPKLSPDGRWLAYASNESGSYEVYVVPYPSLNGRWQISGGGGTEPVWARNGQELYYRGQGKIMAAEISGEHGFSASAPHALFADRFEATQGDSHTCYDVSPDLKTFVMVTRPTTEDAAVTHLNVILRSPR